MGAVDVQHVDLAVHRSVGIGRSSADVAHPVANPRGNEVALEGDPVGGSLRSKPVDLPGSPIVAGVRVDGDDRRALGSVPGEHDGRESLEAADLDDLAIGGTRRCRRSE